MDFICKICAYVYDEKLGDPDNGITPGTKWDELPKDFVCPVCKRGKEYFLK
ncbi:MAG: rubredoxin [Clostridia bacterium]|nr:rubredoxin [Clostridia bacterium]